MHAETRTFTSTSAITVCAECRQPIGNIVLNFDNRTTRNMPCGHKAKGIIIPNPLLGERDA